MLTYLRMVRLVHTARSLEYTRSHCLHCENKNSPSLLTSQGVSPVVSPHSSSQCALSHCTVAKSEHGLSEWSLSHFPVSQSVPRLIVQSPRACISSHYMVSQRMHSFTARSLWLCIVSLHGLSLCIVSLHGLSKYVYCSIRSPEWCIISLYVFSEYT
jgi:hypothetical protein